MNSKTTVHLMWAVTLTSLVCGGICHDYNIVMLSLFWLFPITAIMQYDYRCKLEEGRRNDYTRRRK